MTISSDTAKAVSLKPEAGPLPIEANWPLDELTLAGLSWSSAASGIPVVALHGWLDNATSFARVAPALADHAPFHGIDLAGHGHSGHRSPGHDYTLPDYVADIAELIERHFEGPVNLVGHSLGGIIAAFYAAAFPEKVNRLVMIDSLGPITGEPDHAPEQLRKAITKKMRGSGKSPVYPTIQDAAKVRAGGLSPLSPEAARELVPRNLKQVACGFQWRTDPRLRYPSMLRLDEAQACGILKAIEAPAMLVRAESGLLGERNSWNHRAGLIQSLVQISVPGTHHCHLDGEVTPVVDALREFLQ